MSELVRRLALALCGAALLTWTMVAREAAARTPFAAAIERLSEPEGAFDTDNLISNERSYLDAIPALIARNIRGGAYIGVGPDQNFTYIARIRPTVAYIIDVRRDNLLLHLLFKALFAASRSRVEYLALLTGRPVPSAVDRWLDARIETLADYVDQTAPAEDQDQRHRAIEAALQKFGVPLSAADLDTINRFHAAFIQGGLNLKFTSHGRPPSYFYPTFRELLLARDRAGRAWNFLASEEDYRFLRSLEARDAVIPVVGDVSGPHALRAIGQAIEERGDRLSVFYISNVENYLVRDGTFPRFADNLAHLPHDERSVMIRSIFRGSGSMSLVQPLELAPPHSKAPGR